MLVLLAKNLEKPGWAACDNVDRPQVARGGRQAPCDEIRSFAALPSRAVTPSNPYSPIEIGNTHYSSLVTPPLASGR
jgi:hypothetical protein